MRLVILTLIGVFVVSSGIYAGTTLLGGSQVARTATSTPETRISVPPVPESNFFTPTSENHQEPDAIAQKPRISSELVAACTGEIASDFECYETHYASLVAQPGGIAAAFDDLKSRYALNGFVRAQCHPLTHVIGRFAAKQFKTVGEAYQYGDGYCWSGYYHGVLETFIEEIGLSNLPREIDSVCRNIEGKERYSFDYYNCVHGLGHGVMAATQTELFQSLALCDNLTGTWEQISCGSGVFMENVIVDGLNHKTKYLDPTRPLYPCDESPSKYQHTCYLMQTSYMLKVNGGDFKKTFEWCRLAKGYEHTCWQSLGRDASGRSLSDVERTKATCLLGDNFEEQSNCVVGAVKDFISYFHSDVQARALCNSFENKDLTSQCLSVGESYYRQL